LAQSTTLRVAFQEVGNIAETIVLALQSGGRETIGGAVKHTGKAAGASVAAAVVDAWRIAARELSGLIAPKLLEDKGQLIPVHGIFKAFSDLTGEAADSARLAADAEIEALGALRRRIEAQRELNGLVREQVQEQTEALRLPAVGGPRTLPPNFRQMGRLAF